MCVPPSASDAAIVFKEPIYAPYIDQLCKFFFLSSAIHQAVFCLLSTLPFSGKAGPPSRPSGWRLWCFHLR